MFITLTFLGIYQASPRRETSFPCIQMMENWRVVSLLFMTLYRKREPNEAQPKFLNFSQL